MLPQAITSNGDANSDDAIESGYVKEPEVDFMLTRFRGEKLLDADMKLKSWWLYSACELHFQYRLDRLSHSPSTIHHHISTRTTGVLLRRLHCPHLGRLSPFELFGHLVSSHPYHGLRQASASRSEVEDELQYCYHRTQLPLVPTMDNTIAHWVIDWEPILKIVPWKESFSNHDSVANALMIADSLTPHTLSDLCHAIKNVVWREHCHRMNQLVLYYKVEDYFSKSLVEQSCPCQWAYMINLFHESQLRSLQKIFLDLWMENRATTHMNKKSSSPELAASDRFMFQFVLGQLTGPFLQMASILDDRQVIWRNLIQQYTTSLCCNITSLIHPSKSNPIAHILNPTTKFVTGTDGHTRVMMFRILVSKARRWVEFLVGLQRESSAGDSLNGLFEPGGVGGNSMSKYNGQTHASAPPLLEGATTAASTAVMDDCKKRDTVVVPTNGVYGKPVTDALASLFKMMKNVGALNLLTQEHQRLYVVNPSHFNSICLIDDTLQFDVNSLMQMEEQEENTTIIDSPDAVLRHLIFPYLDYKDLVQPVCKFWTRLAECDLLWKSLYCSHFGIAPVRWSFGVKEHDWKLHFCYALLTT